MRCVGAQANLQPTLMLQDQPGGVVAFQSGQPVPEFDRQPREQIDLDGEWRFESGPVDTSLSLTDRKSALPQLTAELGPRAGYFYDDSSWAAVSVPGTFSKPPHREVTGGYYRRDFFVPTTFSEKYAML